MNKNKIKGKNENQKNNNWKSMVKLKLENCIIEITKSLVLFLFN